MAGKSDMPSVFQSILPCYRVGLAVIELALRVNVQLSGSLVVLVALDVAGLSLPIVSCGFVWKSSVDRPPSTAASRDMP